MDYDTFKSAPLEFKKKLISDFIENTLQYADAHIKTRQEELPHTPASQLEEKAHRLLKWLGYVEFQKHTLAELKTDKLDDFFNNKL